MSDFLNKDRPRASRVRLKRTGGSGGGTLTTTIHEVVTTNAYSSYTDKLSDIDKITINWSEENSPKYLTLTQLTNFSNASTSEENCFRFDATHQHDDPSTDLTSATVTIEYKKDTFSIPVDK